MADQVLLPVPYESQRDNPGQGWRECFSSSCAMIARYWGLVKNDDSYILLRSKFGDTTSALAQVAALRSLGLQSDFWTNGTRKELERQLAAGRPVGVGWLHHGTPQAPTGGGHWSVAIGYTPTAVILNDPYGEPLLRSGGHVPNSSGKAAHCSWENWLPRWAVDGPASGWFVTAAPGTRGQAPSNVVIRSIG